MNRLLVRSLLAAAVLACVHSSAMAAATAESCSAAKVQAAGRKYLAKSKCHAKAIAKSLPVSAECMAKADLKFMTAFDKAEAKGNCATLDDVVPIEAKIDACLIDVVTDVTPGTCGNGVLEGAEECDDGNGIETDGCTSACIDGVACDNAAFPGGDAFAVDADTGHCYVSFDDDLMDFASAETACAGSGAFLVTITSAEEDVLVTTVRNPAQTPWIGADDTAVEGSFAWVTGEPFSYERFAPGQPDDAGGMEDCVHLTNVAGEWDDISCTLVGTAIGRICEAEPAP